MDLILGKIILLFIIGLIMFYGIKYLVFYFEEEEKNDLNKKYNSKKYIKNELKNFLKKKNIKKEFNKNNINSGIIVPWLLHYSQFEQNKNKFNKKQRHKISQINIIIKRIMSNFDIIDLKYKKLSKYKIKDQKTIKLYQKQLLKESKLLFV